MEYSFLTSDNSVFDDFSDSEVGKAKTIDDSKEIIEPKDENTSQELNTVADPHSPNATSSIDYADLIPHRNISTDSNTEPPNTFPILKIQRKANWIDDNEVLKQAKDENTSQELNTVADPHSPDSTSSINIQDISPDRKLSTISNTDEQIPVPILQLPEIIEKTKLSTDSENYQPIDPKNVHDDDLVMALFLCEQNHMVSTQEDTKFTNDNVPSTSHKCEENEMSFNNSHLDVYSDLNHYIKMVTKTSKADKHLVEPKMITTRTIKDYSEENPYAQQHLPTNFKKEKHPEKKGFPNWRKNIKRLRSNKLKVQNFRRLQGRRSSEMQNDCFVQNTYVHFQNEVKKFRISKRTKRLLSSGTSKEDDNNRNIKRQKILLPTTRKPTLSRLIHRQARVKKPEMSTHTYELRSKCKQATCKRKKQRKTTKSKVKKKSLNSLQQCDPYVKQDPDYKPNCKLGNQTGNFLKLRYDWLTNY